MDAGRSSSRRRDIVPVPFWRGRNTRFRRFFFTMMKPFVAIEGLLPIRTCSVAVRTRVPDSPPFRPSFRVRV